MFEYKNTEGHVQLLIPLSISPRVHQQTPTITGGIFSEEAGTVLYGHYMMEYLLPGGDKLRLFANHDKKSVQIILITHNPEILKILPGERASSLVAETIRRLNLYIVQSNSYRQPLNKRQQKKLNIVNQAINQLNELLPNERELDSQDYHGQEGLRKQVLSIIDDCNHANRYIAIKPTASEGTLGYMLYDAYKTAAHFHFNRVYSVSTQDQMDFTEKAKVEPTTPLLVSGEKKNSLEESKKPIFIWDSEVHVGHQNDELHTALQVICQHYQLTPAKELSNKPASRFAKLASFFYKLHQDAHDWISYISTKENAEHRVDVTHFSTGISITNITPYYVLSGLHQEGYASLDELMHKLTKSTSEIKESNSIKEAIRLLSQSKNGDWVNIQSINTILLRVDNNLHTVKYFSHDNQFYPLPSGEDLYTLSQVSKRHLYLPERFNIKIRAFLSNIPSFFKYFYRSLYNFISKQLINDFINHIHSDHPKREMDHVADNKTISKTISKNTIHAALVKHGLLPNGQTLEGFIKEQMNKSPYVIARANHPPSPPTYDNPFHRILNVTRHIGAFFVDTSERNPLIGSLAMAAYFYGAGAVIAPEVLESVLKKLHLEGLIAGIEPTQQLAKWMSNGTFAEALAASVTLWQGVVAGGNLDTFFATAINLFKEDPAEIAIILSLAMSLGYGLTKLIPSLAHEMGEFPYTNYLALGGKGGAAIYDTIMHPGDDWLLGSCKWVCKFALDLCKIVVAPVIEGFHYGFSEGFLNGWKKGIFLAGRLLKQSLAATIDFILAVSTIPLLEMSAMFIHVPYKGLTNLLIKLLGALGNIKSIGKLICTFALRPGNGEYISSFTFLPLYGFTNPFGDFYPKNPIFNALANIIRLIVLPPLELIKNFIFLPALDTISFTGRVALTLIDSSSRVFTYTLGTIIFYFGLVSDNSVGLIFSMAAKGLAISSNWLDKQLGVAKQFLVSAIEIKRHQLYHWAFAEEDQHSHQTLTDIQYFLSHPRRCEKILHEDKNTQCLYDVLLKEPQNSSRIVTKQEPLVNTIFKVDKDVEVDGEPEVAFGPSGL